MPETQHKGIHNWAQWLASVGAAVLMGGEPIIGFAEKVGLTVPAAFERIVFISCLIVFLVGTLTLIGRFFIRLEWNWKKSMGFFLASLFLFLGALVCAYVGIKQIQNESSAKSAAVAVNPRTEVLGSVNVPPSSQSEPQPSERFYSTKEKEYIADAFYELKSLLNDDVLSLRDSVQDVNVAYWKMGGINSIMHISPPMTDQQPLDMDVLIFKVSAVGKKTDDVREKIFRDFPKKHKAFETLWEELLSDESSFQKLSVNAHKFLENLENAKPIYELNPTLSRNILRGLDPYAKEFAISPDVWTWIETINVKIKQKEADILRK